MPIRFGEFGPNSVTAFLTDENVAGAMGIPVVNVFPLPSSLDFWRKMGYTPTPCMTRVLRRDLSVGGNSAGWGNEHLDDHRETVARQEIIAS